MLPLTQPPPATATRWTTAANPWLLAALTATVGIGLRALLHPVLAEQLPFVMAFPVTAFTALLWGSGPGLLAAALSVLAVFTPLIAGHSSLAERPLQVGVFCVSAVVTCLICGHSRRKRAEPAVAAETQADTALTAWLRAVLVGAVAIPTVIFAVACWWGYERAYAEAESSVSHASALALRQAERTFANAFDVA